MDKSQHEYIDGTVNIDLEVEQKKADKLVATLKEAKSLINDLASYETVDPKDFVYKMMKDEQPNKKALECLTNALFYTSNKQVQELVNQAICILKN